MLVVSELLNGFKRFRLRNDKIRAKLKIDEFIFVKMSFAQFLSFIFDFYNSRKPRDSKNEGWEDLLMRKEKNAPKGESNTWDLHPPKV